jgi:hypothetical protein
MASFDIGDLVKIDGKWHAILLNRTYWRIWCFYGVKLSGIYFATVVSSARLRANLLHLHWFRFWFKEFIVSIWFTTVKQMKNSCTQMVSKLACVLSLIKNAYLERNNSNKDHNIGLLSLFQNTSLSVFCSNALHP